MHDQPSARLVCDRRRDARDECAIDAEVRAGDERFPCRIRDISEGGARIDVPAGRDVPHAFTLDIPVLDQVVEPRACERRWRVADVVGLRFL